jgi:hypothetical protein
MKTTKTVYWVSTILFSLLFARTGTLYLVKCPVMVTKIISLNHPLYLLATLGTAKILGAVALAVPKYPRLKEWAYAGFYFDFIGAFWSHLVVQGVTIQGLIVLNPLILISISYLSYRKLEREGRPVAVVFSGALLLS